jgi:hypothetical protein
MVDIESTRAKLTVTHLERAVFVAMICSAIACDPTANPVSDAPIIKKYGVAACVPLSTSPRIAPDAREWNATLTLRSGTKVLIRGAQVPGGRVEAFYPDQNRNVVAADPGDYVYPADVRLDAQNGLLYVKAYGLAGGVAEQTLLFEFDLHGQRIVERLQVRNGVLPVDCQDASHSQ